MLRYLSYDNLNIDEELAKIEKSDSAEIVLDQHNKKCLFILGMLFVNGVKLKVLNGKELGFDNFEFESDQITQIETEKEKVNILVTHGTLNGATHKYHDIKESWLTKFDYVALRPYTSSKDR